MSSATLNSLSLVISILIGSGAILGGTWKVAAMLLRRAVSAEQARDASAAAAQQTSELLTAHQATIQDHEYRLITVEGHLWPRSVPSSQTTQSPLSSSTTAPSRAADIRARLPSPPRSLPPRTSARA